MDGPLHGGRCTLQKGSARNALFWVRWWQLAGGLAKHSWTVFKAADIPQHSLWTFEYDWIPTLCMDPHEVLEFLQLRRFGVSTGAHCPETNLDVPLKDGWLIRSPQYSSLRLLCVENIEVSQSVRDAGVFVDINCFGVRGIPVYPSGVVNPGKFIVAQVFFFLSSNQAVQTREII